jgi:Ni/Co efflux regulator RcnB
LAARLRRANIAAFVGIPVRRAEPLMKKLLAAVFVAALAFAHGAAFAQEKKAEAKKEEMKTTEAKKDDAKKSEAKKEETKKKEKKGGC